MPPFGPAGAALLCGAAPRARGQCLSEAHHPRGHLGRPSREATAAVWRFRFSLLSADDQVVFEGAGVKKPPIRRWRRWSGLSLWRHAPGRTRLAQRHVRCRQPHRKMTAECLE